MALPAAGVWEIRPAGAATNGGGYNSTRAGATTDYSQQAAAQFTYTDLVIGAANTVTSAAFPFTTLAIGNFLHINSGATFTPGFYEVTNVVGAVATLDRSPGTLAATGGNAKLGGALSSVVDLPTLVDGNIVWVVGSFTTNAQWNLNASGTNGQFNSYYGYGTTRGDNGLATVTASVNLDPIFNAGVQTIVRNFKVDGANLANRGITFGGDDYGENLWVTRTILAGITAFNEGTRLRRCLADHTLDGIIVGTGCIASECEAHHCSEGGFDCENGTGIFESCVSHDNSGSGFRQFGDDGPFLINCTADGNTLDGFRLDTARIETTMVINCLFTNNGGFGVRSTAHDYSVALSAPMAVFFRNNAYYNNTAGNYSSVSPGISDVILTADPYTNAGGDDYSLNGTTGGGAAARGAGVPGGFGLLGAGTLASTGHKDIGAVQTLGAAPTPSGVAGLRSLWREFTGEHDTAVPDDSVVDLWIDRGLEALNRRLRYHWTTDSTSIVLVSGTQEYALPTDLIELRWVQWNGRELAKGDIQEWRRNYDEWRNEPAGEPQQFAIHGDKLVIRPVPSGEAVAAAASPVFRYCSKPPSVTSAGAEQLNTQNQPVAVAYGAGAYCGSYPDSAAFQSRQQSLMKLFEDEVQTLALDSRDKALQK